MSEQQKPASKLFWIIIAGLVSLVVGVAGAVLGNYFTESRPQLSYDITSIEVFPGESNQLGIVAILVENPGGKEIEDLQCHVELIDAKLMEPRCKGIAKNSIKIQNDSNAVDISVPFFNPTETFSLQLLVEPEGDALVAPHIDIRGKGIVAKPKSEGTQTRSSLIKLLPSLLGISSSILATFIMALSTVQLRSGKLKSFRRAIESLANRDGLGTAKRDGFAFLVGLHGSPEFATEIRQSQRSLTWWTLSDSLTERALSQTPRKEDDVRNATIILQKLLDSTDQISLGSTAIIQTNIARLFMALEDENSAIEWVTKAKESSRRIADRRCKLVPELKNIENPGQAA